MTDKIWKFKDYKPFLNSLIEASSQRRGAISRLARSIGCQPSYLSQVLHSHVHLTPDQAYLTTTFFSLGEDECEYFLALVDFARAASPEFKKKLTNKMNDLRSRNQEIGQKLKRKSLENFQDQNLYYSSWIWGALHVLVAVPEYQTIDAISKRLNLSSEVLLPILQKLESFGFIKNENGKWTYVGGEVHLPRQSPLISLHHNNWRQRAILDSQKNSDEGIHFSGAYVLAKKDVEKIKELVQGLITAANAVAGPSESEELVCLNCDFFIV